MSTLKEKQNKMKSLQAKINKVYGKEVLFSGSEGIKKGIFDATILPTPSLELNQALYCGGIGGIVELFGAPASGKTSLALEIIAKAQKNDPNFTALWLETEHSIFPEILQQHGIDINRAYILEQGEVDNAENAFDIIEAAVRNETVNLVVVNSVAGLLPKVESEEDIAKQNIALTARLMSKFFRKITGIASKTKTTLLFINQIRDNVGVRYGDPTVTTGGRALAFYAHQRIKMNSNKIQASDPITADQGVKVSCIVCKNRYAGMHSPYTKCVYYAMFDTGIDSVVAIPQLLADNNIFQRAGAWWYYPNKDNIATIAGVECKFNSQNALIKALKENDQFLKEITEMISSQQISQVSSEEQEQLAQEENENKEFMEEFNEE